jgi:hypothetical protein
MSTFPDGVFQHGGVPVGGSRFEGMWGNKSYFVDYDNGRSGGTGTRASDPGKYLDDALTAASAWDTIYVRGRTTADTDGGDPYYVLPKSTANFTTTVTQYGLSIIGTQIGRGLGSMHGTTQIRGSDSANATPALKVVGPMFNMENICWRRGGSTVAAVQITGTAFDSTISNCAFQKVTTYPALLNTDAWYTGIYNCVFQSCLEGITIHAATSPPQNIVIKDCDFMGLAAEISADIYVNATGTGLVNALIKGCTFNHTVPSGGKNRYVVIDAASTGLIADCWSGAAAATVANYYTLNGLNYSHLHGGNNVNIATT